MIVNKPKIEEELKKIFYGRCVNLMDSINALQKLIASIDASKEEIKKYFLSLGIPEYIINDSLKINRRD